MQLWHAAVLGTLQGLTEILPISSSAHLLLLPWVCDWPASGLTFDVALHLGTLVALLAYFRRDVADLLGGVVRSVSGEGVQPFTNRLPWLLIAGSVPAAIAGKALEKPVEELFRQSPLLIASLLIAFGLLLAVADRNGAKRLEVADFTLRDVLLVGLAQCLALAPGVSRSGITITAALLLGYRRESAARFSFLLSLPIVSGAALLKVGSLLRHGMSNGELAPLAVGMTCSALAGYASIALLLKLVQRHSLAPFVWYRLLLGGGIMLGLLLKH